MVTKRMETTLALTKMVELMLLMILETMRGLSVKERESLETNSNL